MTFTVQFLFEYESDFKEGEKRTFKTIEEANAYRLGVNDGMYSISIMEMNTNER